MSWRAAYARSSETDKVYRAFEVLEDRLGRPPSIREVQEEADVGSTSTVSYHVNKLVGDGRIERHGESGSARRYRTTRKIHTMSSDAVIVSRRLVDACSAIVITSDPGTRGVWVDVLERELNRMRNEA